MAKSCKEEELSTAAGAVAWCLDTGPSPVSQKADDPHSFGTPGTGPNIKHWVPLTWNLNLFLSRGKNVA